ncbi:MAG: GAF domain-containing protein [Xanthobacteraceae bacterium]
MRRRSGAARKPAKTRRCKAVRPKRRSAPKIARRSAANARETAVERLTRELNEAIEQQTATSEVLSVISSSPGELEPVFQAMLENAVRICEAKFGVMFRFEGDVYDSVATLNLPPAVEEFLRHRGRRKPTPGSDLDKLLSSKEVVQTPDMAASPNPSRIANLAGVRTQLAVPLLKDGALVGAINIYRQEVRPFTDKQIALVQNFAAQAVIAIENTQLLAELRQSLEQQTATADVLGVINASRGELQPVFEAMVEKARRLCEADAGHLALPVGDDYRSIAVSAMSLEMEALIRSVSYAPGRGTAVGRALAERRPVQISDIGGDNEHAARQAAEKGFIRTILGVPLLREGEAIGAFGLSRQRVEPFSERQIELVQNFAAQAVIAIENTRLLVELRQRTDDLSEALEQQTATSEVLSVISSSPGTLEPVFKAILENATRICAAQFGNLFLYDGQHFQFAAMHGVPAEFVEARRRQPVIGDNPTALIRHVVEKKKVLHVADITAKELRIEENDPALAELAKLAGARTLVTVPMLKDGALIGAVTIFRQEVRPFTDKQIALVQNFAAQAVIAIENTRLLKELRQRTEDLSASLEDLRTAQDRLVQTEKLASLGQLTAGIAHEIKNPLNFVNNFSGLSVELIDELRETLNGVNADEKTLAEIAELTSTLRDNLDKIAHHGKRADSIVKNMLLHSREGSGERRPVDINALVEESLNLAYHGARAEKQSFNINLERSFDPAAGEVDLFPQEITRVLLNLIANGFYAAGKRRAQATNGDYEPTLAAATKNLGDRVEIRIRDNGTGIPPEVKDKMFNPFFTTKPAGEGTGLGLSISHDIIVKQHAGAIEVDTEPGKFTEFRIVLPRTGARSSRT